MDNFNFLGYNIKVKSIAGHGTCVYIKELKIAFDMGIMIDSWVHNVDNVFISHGHCDHIGSLHFHGRFRRLYKLDKIANYYLPSYCIDNFNKLYQCIASMDKGIHDTTKFIYDKSHYNIISSDSLIKENCYINPGLYMKSYEMKHKIKNFGYCLFNQKKKLKQDFINFSKNEIIELKKKNIEISDIISEPLIAYSGDTTIDGILQYPDFLKAKLLIMECSFYDDEVNPDESNKRGHIHIEDIKRNEDKFLNEKILLIHISYSYKKKYVLDIIDKSFSENFKSKLMVSTCGLDAD
ncbi:Hypothetical protein KVN_LOCUS240 [uncultured virus]|nr:Hypothetical protein KVN_LOCUS240 [uncultured virus]